MSAEQRKQLSDKMRQRAEEARERKAQSSTAVLERPADIDLSHSEPEGDEPTSEGILAELAGLFNQAAGKKQGRDKAINDALELLGSLDVIKYADIAENPKVQSFIERVQASRLKAADVKPGTILGTGIAAMKKPWTWAILKRGMNVPVEEVTRRNAAGEVIFPWIEYRPIKTCPIQWNGLKVFFRARQLVYVCKVFVDVFEESLNNEEFAEQHAAWLFNTPGVSARRDFFTTSAPRIKAMDQGRGEYYQPGGGMISLAASPDLVGLGGGNADAE